MQTTLDSIHKDKSCCVVFSLAQREKDLKVEKERGEREGAVRKRVSMEVKPRFRRKKEHNSMLGWWNVEE